MSYPNPNMNFTGYPGGQPPSGYPGGQPPSGYPGGQPGQGYPQVQPGQAPPGFPQTFGYPAAEPGYSGQTPQLMPYARQQVEEYPVGHPGSGPLSEPVIMPEVQAWFSAVDQDRSGKISTKELQAALVNAQGRNFSEAACALMISLFDYDKSGTIEILSFQLLYKYLNEWLCAFRNYDRDHSGHIEESELSQALTQMGFRFSAGFTKFLVEKSDLQNHKQITVDQFVLLCIQIQKYTEAFRSHDKDMKGIITISFEDFLTVALSCSL